LSHLNKIAEVVNERQVPCVLCCDLVLACKLQAVVKECPDLSHIKSLHTLVLGTPAEAKRHKTL